MSDEVNATKEKLWKSHSKTGLGSSSAEGLVGLGAMALAIIGLANIIPFVLMSVASIAVGLALAFEGGAISARYSALMDFEEGPTQVGASARWGGVTTLFLAGSAGITLGILSLLGIVPMILIPVSALIYGAALILDSGTNARLSVLEARHSDEFKAKESTIKETAQATAGIQVLAGIGSIVLGILALNGVSPLVLSLVVMLSIGAANSLTGTIIGGRITRILRKQVAV
jgi:hypothetical protein